MPVKKQRIVVGNKKCQLRLPVEYVAFHVCPFLLGNRGRVADQNVYIQGWPGLL
jgi:hypothetical protein